MNIKSELDGWTQYYLVTIHRPNGTKENFVPMDAKKTVELVQLCLTIDDPHAGITISPVKPEITH